MKVLYVSKALVVASYRSKIRCLSSHVNIRAAIPYRWPPRGVEPVGGDEPWIWPQLVRFAGHPHLHWYPELGQALDAFRPDLVHIDEEPYSAVTTMALRACVKRRVPAVLFAAQNIYKRLPPPFGAFRRYALRTIAAAQAGTAQAEQVLRDAGFRGAIATFPQLGIDETVFRPDATARVAARALLGVKPETVVVGFGGRLVRYKAVSLLLDAVAHVPNVVLAIAGDGPERRRLARQARALRIGDRVRFQGHLGSAAMPGWLAGLDMLVLPSISTPGIVEQFGRILVEAMACGVPVIGSSSGGIPGVIGKAGVVCGGAGVTAVRDALAAPRRDGTLGLLAVLVGALGLMIALAGAGMRDLNLALGGSATVAAALIVLIAGGWVSGLVCVAIALPLPPVYSSETLRVSPAAIITLAAVLGWALRRGLDRRPLALGALPRWPTALLLAAVALAAAFADHLGPAARELLSMAELLGLLVAATDELSANPDDVRPLLWTLTVVLGIAGVVAVLQSFGAPPREFPLPDSGFYRANLGFAGPTELGMYMGLGLPIAGYLWRAASGRPARLVALACLVSGVLGLAATFSRGSWLAVVASAVVLVLARQSRFAVQIWFGAIVAALAVQALSGGAVTDRFTSAAGLASIDQRVALMLVGLLIFQAHPVLGVGPGGFPAALDHFGPQVPGLWDYVGAAHNAYVHMAAESGVVGLVALVAIMGACLLALVRRVRAGGDALARALAWAFAMACAMGLVEWIYVHGVGELIMLLAAMGFATPRERAA